jgi:hypothetical protein
MHWDAAVPPRPTPTPIPSPQGGGEEFAAPANRNGSTGIGNPHTGLTPAWLPSQSGGVPVRLQAQNATRLDSAAVHFSGVNGVPAWEPSQNGWFEDLPQAHHQ